MNYSIEVLEKEKDLIDRCLNGFDKVEYSTAYDRQKKKSKELEYVINKLKNRKIDINF